MSVQFAKLTKETFTSDNGEFHIYAMRCHGGEMAKAVYVGEDAPKPLKTAEYQLTGDWVNHPRFGRQFEIRKYERVKKAVVEEVLDRRALADSRKRLDPKDFGVEPCNADHLKWWE